MIKLAVIAASLLASSVALAQTCAAPIAIQSDNNNGAYAPGGATTCGAANAIGVLPGGIASPQPDIIHSFVAQGANATITLNTAGGALEPGLVIMDGCDDTANLLAVADGAAGSEVNVSATGLTDGQTYFLVVTGRPGSPDDNCGPYTGTITGTLPVTVQTFDVE